MSDRQRNLAIVKRAQIEATHLAACSMWAKDSLDILCQQLEAEENNLSQKYATCPDFKKRNFQQIGRDLDLLIGELSAALMGPVNG